MLTHIAKNPYTTLAGVGVAFIEAIKDPTVIGLVKAALLGFLGVFAKDFNK
jgi:hypothetical protein